MKLVVTHTDLRLYWPARIQALVEALAPEGVSVNVLEVSGCGSPYAFAGPSLGGSMCPWEILYPDTPMESIDSREASVRLFNRLDELQPNVVLAGAIAYTSGSTAVRWARTRRRAVVIMDDARVADVPRSMFVNWVKRRIYANVDAVLAPADPWVRDFEFFGVPREKLAYGVNVVDNEAIAARVARARSDGETVRRQLGLPVRFVLGVGRQVPKKNWHALISAFAAVRDKRGADWSLVLVGEGPERVRLERLAATFASSVTFLPFQDQDALCQIYSQATALVLPSEYGETWGLVVNEAMAAGLPVVVSQTCGCAATMVRSGENGWTFDPTSSDDLIGVLRRLTNASTEDLGRMGARSREIVSDWGLDRFCSGVRSALRQVGRRQSSGFASPVDRLLLRIWRGRYRPA